MMEWISVKDCLPSQSEKERLIWGPEIGFQIATFTGRECVGYLKHPHPYGSKGSLYRWYPDGIPGITHWMPLPEPPKRDTTRININVYGDSREMILDDFMEFIGDAVRKAIG